MDKCEIADKNTCEACQLTCGVCSVSPYPLAQPKTTSRNDGAGCGGGTVGAINCNLHPWELLKVAKPIDEFDLVTFVKHYQVIPEKGVEAIHIVNALLGCEEARSITPYQAACYKDVIKYTLRALKKGKFIEDLKKAATYIKFITEDANGK